MEFASFHRCRAGKAVLHALLASPKRWRLASQPPEDAREMRLIGKADVDRNR